MTAPLLESYVAGRWYAAPDDGTPARRRGDRRDGRPASAAPASTCRAMLDHARAVGGPALRELTFHQRAGAAQAARPAPDGATRTSSTRCPGAPAPPTGTARSTSTAASARCSPTPARAAASCPTTPSSSTAPSEQLGRARHVRRPARLHPAARASRCRSTPSTSRSGACWRSWRPAFLAGRADRRQAGQPDRLPDRAGRPPDRRVGPAARGLGAAARRQRRRRARPPGRAGPGLLHRLGGHRAQAAQPPRGGRQLGAVQRRGRLAQLLGPRPGRRRRAPPSSTCSSSSSSPR